MKKRTAFETTLIRRIPRKVDFMRYVAYEMGLETLRSKRVKRLSTFTCTPISTFCIFNIAFHLRVQNSRARPQHPTTPSSDGNSKSSSALSENSQTTSVSGCNTSAPRTAPVPVPSSHVSAGARSRYTQIRRAYTSSRRRTS